MALNNMISMAWRGMDGDERIWGAEWRQAGGPGVWHEPRVLGAGAFNSTHAPSLAIRKAPGGATGVFIIWKGSGDDQAIYMSTPTGEVGFNPRGPSHETFLTTGRPALTFIDKFAMIAWRAPGNDAVLWSLQNTNFHWSEPQQTGAQSSCGPAVATLNGTIYMACKALADDQIWWAQFANGSWGLTSPLPVDSGAAMTSDTPTLVAGEDSLTMVWKGSGSDPTIWWSEFRPGGNWTTPIQLTPSDGAILTSSGPALATPLGNPEVMWKGSGDQSIWSSSVDGAAWQIPGVIRPDINSADSPATVTGDVHVL
ncbi:hypothetical protein [Kitasatospora sp. NPDC058218]|uniref:hypothetical protein n=1 Tax=Kitasatospora sp. NPDC058218 TaxID=3346385 RepID=UPI0036DED288